MSTHARRKLPVAHTWRATAVPRVLNATITSFDPATAAFSVPIPMVIRMPTTPVAIPIKATTSPAISGGKRGLRERMTCENIACRTPATMVIPKTSGSPPWRIASIEGTR